MADAVRLEIDGLRRLQRELRAAGSDMADIKDANAKAADIVATAAGSRAPHGPTGRLAASGRGNRAAGRATVTFGGATVPYAGRTHYGWPAVGQAAQPFVLEAAEATSEQWLGAYVDDLQNVLDHVAAAGPY